jgi:ATP synthase protein I
MATSKYKQLGDLLTIGIMFPACIGIGYGIGYVLDRWVGTQSTFKIIFLLFGIAAGFINLFRMVNKFSSQDETPGK